MKLYIANGSRQVQCFWYRLPGNWAKPIELVIPPGMQAIRDRDADREFNSRAFDSILLFTQRYQPVGHDRSRVGADEVLARHQSEKAARRARPSNDRSIVEVLG